MRLEFGTRTVKGNLPPPGDGFQTEARSTSIRQGPARGASALATRRAHAFPGQLSVFDENLALFEGIWYGMHDVSADGVNQFAANLERLKAGA